MRLPRAPGLARPRRGPDGVRAAVLAGAVVLAVLAVAAVTARPAPARPAAAVTLARATLAAGTVPAAPPAASWPAAAGAVSLPGTGGCGLLDFNCYISNAITSWFAGLVKSAVNPLLALIGQTALSTPQPDSIPAVRTLWSTSLGIADACYALLVLIGGIIVMSHETLQTSYSAKEIAPRVVLGFIAANLSMVLMTRAVGLANGLSAAFTAGGVDPQTAAASLMTTLGNAVSNGGIFLILLAAAGVVLALVLALVYVIRLMAVVLLAAAAPVLLALLLPAADRLGRPLVVAGAHRGPGRPGRPGPGPDRRRAGVPLSRLAARPHQQHPGTDPDHLVPAVHLDAHPVLDRAARSCPRSAGPRCAARPGSSSPPPSCPASRRCYAAEPQPAARAGCAAYPREPAVAGPARGPGPARHRAGTARRGGPATSSRHCRACRRRRGTGSSPCSACRRALTASRPARHPARRPRRRGAPGRSTGSRRCPACRPRCAGPGSSRSPSTRRPGRAAPGQTPEGNRR